MEINGTEQQALRRRRHRPYLLVGYTHCFDLFAGLFANKADTKYPGLSFKGVRRSKQSFDFQSNLKVSFGFTPGEGVCFQPASSNQRTFTNI